MPDLPPQDINHIRHAIRRTFFDPFRSWRRSAIFFGVLSGYFGFTLVNVASSYGLGDGGLRSLLSYFIPALLLPGFVFWPLLYLGFSTIDGIAWRVFILLTQMAALAAFLLLPKDPIIQGIVSGILSGPFWTSFHIAMVQNTTSENRAFEVSLSGFLGITGSIGGTIICGILLTRGLDHAAVCLAFITSFTGTVAILAATKPQPNAKARVFFLEAKNVINENPYLVRRIITQSLYDMPGYALAAMMHLLSFSAGLAAALLASRMIAEFLLAPIVGHFVHTRRNKGFGIGMAFIGCGWLFLLVSPQNSLSLIIFMLIYGTGIRFAFNSMISGLYEMQKYASMMWTEVFLGVGRALGMIFLMPLLYYSINLYMLELAVLAAVLFILNRLWMRKWKII